MTDTDNRHIARDSLFLFAQLRLDGESETHRVKVRNLSAGGMMGEGRVRVERGSLIEVELRNCGWIEGSIAWVHGDRFGIAFREEIDPKIARAPTDSGNDSGHTPRFVRPPITQQDPTRLRKI